MSKVFRKATLDDLDSVYKIIKDAKQQLKDTGSTQWQSGEPSLQTIKDDILNSTCYVVDDGTILATLNISFEGDLPYRVVYDGNWSNDDVYTTLHRVAISQSSQGKGVMSFILNEVVSLSKFNGIHQIRVDTYYKNNRMINSLINFGFKRAGIIHVNDPIDPEREAFEYIFNSKICKKGLNN